MNYTGASKETLVRDLPSLYFFSKNLSFQAFFKWKYLCFKIKNKMRFHIFFVLFNGEKFSKGISKIQIKRD